VLLERWDVPRRWYVLAGTCAIEVGSSSWEMRTGDIADIPAGDYRFRVTGSKCVELVRVWELPPGIQGGGA
jgi:mannose-6-phosphate isomerase-like protein (cupin superfamily)